MFWDWGEIFINVPSQCCPYCQLFSILGFSRIIQRDWHIWKFNQIKLCWKVLNCLICMICMSDVWKPDLVSKCHRMKQVRALLCGRSLNGFKQHGHVSFAYLIWKDLNPFLYRWYWTPKWGRVMEYRSGKNGQ